MTHESAKATLILTARVALARGDTCAAERLAHEALEAAERAGNFEVQAQACLILGQAAVLRSRIRRAYALSSQALDLFTRESHAAGRARALALVSYTASTLSMDDVALRAAKACVALREQVPSEMSLALGYTYLGVASYWAKDFDAASGTLEASAWFAEDEQDAKGASFHPLVNFCFSEVLRAVDMERRGEPVDVSQLQRLLGEAWARTTQWHTATLSISVGTADVAQMLLDFSSCFYFSRIGRPTEAFGHYQGCVRRSTLFERDSWLQAIVCWARLEMARMHDDHELGLGSATAMRDYARRGEHLHLQALAQEFKTKLQAHPT